MEGCEDKPFIQFLRGWKW